MAELSNTGEGEDQKALSDLKKLIRAFIENCDPKVTPNICRVAANKEGYAMIERAIIKKCSSTGSPVGSAMAEFDNELQHAYD